MDTEGESQVSAFLEKQKLLDWLDDKVKKASGREWNDYRVALTFVVGTIELGQFDWTGEGD